MLLIIQKYSLIIQEKDYLDIVKSIWKYHLNY